MDATATPASRNKRPKGASGTSQRRPAASGRSAQARRLASRLAVAGGALAVFIAGFIFDPDAVVRLFWACLMGHAGQPARVAAFAIVLAAGCTIVLALRPPARSPPPKLRKKAAPRPVANSKPIETVETVGEGPVSGTRGGKRSRRSGGNT